MIQPFEGAAKLFLSECGDVKSGSVGEYFTATTQPLVPGVDHFWNHRVVEQTVTVALGKKTDNGIGNDNCSTNRRLSNIS